ncbi:helix-turn-helix domain-containing protein [Streptomyces griseoviridis]|uniref:TetR family transcriptional regulator n=1 Tax=Streptomyces griseoviridis TaxID=45398 RepID=A0A918L8Y1_STRGD|nr:TetR/AcrR family transcriptional regulator [Streptomyces niveoruber]GGS19929.1 TetR family transcriptional regulator [Streptomyces niveoruber]
MARWEPGTAERLQAAALELFATRGYERTTATEIAQSVGLTERTFFRHFQDKREVLFHGQDRLSEAILDGVRGAPDDASPLDTVARALCALAPFFSPERRASSRTRKAVVDDNPALQERELRKLADLAVLLADTLRARGVGDLAATVAAQTGTAVFGVAFGRWVRDGEERGFAEVVTEVHGELLALAGRAAPVA